MNRKNMPLILMLVAGIVTSIFTFVKRYTISEKMLALLVTLIVFYLLGSLLRGMLDRFQAQNEKAALDEGAVVEKEGEQENGGEDVQAEQAGEKDPRKDAP